MQKIFSQNKIIFIGNVATADKMVVYTDPSSLFKDYLDFINNSAFSSLLIKTNNVDNVWQEFQNLFKLIEAAGGVVKNKKEETLMIFRHNRWDLPKGKLEKGETIESAAVREVEEECGITNIAITEALPTTYHTYVLDGKHLLKKTYWFMMRYAGTSKNLTPQLEESITEAKWMNENDIRAVADNTYPLIRTVLTSLPLRH